MRRINSTTNGIATGIVDAAHEAGCAARGSNLPNPTLISYGTVSYIFDHFNRELFGGELPHCLITLQRRPKACGYFDHERFITRDLMHRVSEIALNPRYWGPEHSDADNLSTLVHEQVHLLQAVRGKPARDGYHDRAWANTMIEIGLPPSSTGAPGGRTTGRRVSHFIREGGPFDLACTALLSRGITIPYHEVREQGQDPGAVRRKRSRAASKTPYTCPSCFPRVQTWGRPKLELICKPCGSDLVAEDGEEANWIDRLKDDQ